MKVSTLIDIEALEYELDHTKTPLITSRQILTDTRLKIKQHFELGEDINALLRLNTRLVDMLLLNAWQQLNIASSVCLLAVGGYGREELFPFSDIDLLILVPSPLSEQIKTQIEHFLTLIWDIGLAIGHSVRTIEETTIAAQTDITVITNLIELRYLCGDKSAHQQLISVINPKHMWPSKQFFQAKLQEQRARHKKYKNTAYYLEPDVKSSPGGLRDIHTLVWIAKRHFQVNHLQELVSRGVVTEREYRELRACRSTLCKIRFALHLITNRAENRLLFDHQQSLAKYFDYQARSQNVAIEQFMQTYYRSAKTVNVFNELFLQLFREHIVEQHRHIDVVMLSDRFRLCNHYIEASHAKVFRDTPSSLLEIFVLLAKNPQIKGIRASTIRLLIENRYLVDEGFRQDETNIGLFLELLRHHCSIADQLQRMNRYGILERYIPSFAPIVGHMQYDLYHTYTVDQHLLFVVNFLQKFSLPEAKSKFPQASALIKTIDKPELLVIAALFHDIAKGRGGDHSELGAAQVKTFSKTHHLSSADTILVTWLVQHHLLMSMVAQRMDIHDPDVVKQFAEQIPDQNYLKSLYLLTIADICATNETLWNSWRSDLLSRLYESTKQYLKAKQQTVINQEQMATQIKQRALSLLTAQGIKQKAVLRLWQQWKLKFFLRHAPEDIAWYSQAILQHANSDEPLVALRSMANLAGTEIFIYIKKRNNLFATATAVMDRLFLNIVEASIDNSKHNYCLSSYIVLDENNQCLTDSKRLTQIKQELKNNLQSNHVPLAKGKRLSRRLQYFTSPTRVDFKDDPKRKRTILEIHSLDRPGLLAHIGRVFRQFNISVQTAKIATYGEQVEDVFYITSQSQQAIQDTDLQQQISKAICAIDGD